jgi:hypothetical protein
MKLIIKIFILFVLAFSFNVFAQESKDTTSTGFPYSIYSIDCKRVDKDFVMDYRTHFSNDFITYAGINFEIDLNLTLKDNAIVPDSTIGVIIQSWHGDEERYVLRPDNAISKNKYYFHYVFDFRSLSRGMASCRLVWYNKIDNTYSPFKGDAKSISEDFFLQ